jgi:hypothetical protein
MTMIFQLANAQSITATGVTATYLMNKTPFCGGASRNAILQLQGAVGGSGVINLEGNNASDYAQPAANDPGWATVVSLTSASPLTQEILLPKWLRVNVATAGTGTITANLEGVQ